MDWNTNCDDLSAPFEPTADDWMEWPEEDEEDFDTALGAPVDFFKWVDTLNQ